MHLGDHGQFEQAYRRYAPRAVAAAQAVLGDPARAEEVAQEVFYRLWRDPGRFDSQRGELGPYVVLMARSRALDLWRTDQTARRAQDRVEVVAAATDPPADVSPDAVMERHAERAILLRGLSGLPAAQREALVLTYWGDLTVAEIARRCRVPLGTVKSRLRLGLEKLARLEGASLRPVRPT